jgi:hypothetical protein
MILLSSYYREGYGSTKEEFEALAEKCQVGIGSREETGTLYASLHIISTTGWRATLSEFPGNCSSLVLSNIQDGIHCSKESIDSILKFSIALCERLEYGALFASGTTGTLRKYLEEQGFTPVLEGLFNPHSSSFNTFYVKKFFQREEKDV